jgi:hypothetical protein
MLNSEEKNTLLNQVQTDVSLISFMTVISVFFIGSLLSQFNSQDPSIKIPISFLIIATFAFLFSALILSNSSPRIGEGNSEKTERYFSAGYALSEYLGVFLFVLSIPLAINVITTDLYLRITTFCATIAGIGFYQFAGFSLLDTHFSKTSKFFSLLVILFSVALFVSQVYAFHFTLISALFLAFIIAITFLAPIKRFQ